MVRQGEIGLGVSSTNSFNNTMKFNEELKQQPNRSSASPSALRKSHNAALQSMLNQGPQAMQDKHPDYSHEYILEVTNSKTRSSRDARLSQNKDLAEALKQGDEN